MKGSKKVASARPGAVKKSRGAQVGSGGQGRQALEGKGPTPKAEDRSWHVAGKRKAAIERYQAAGGKGKPGQKGRDEGSASNLLFLNGFAEVINCCRVHKNEPATGKYRAVHCRQTEVMLEWNRNKAGIVAILESCFCFVLCLA